MRQVVQDMPSRIPILIYLVVWLDELRIHPSLLLDIESILYSWLKSLLWLDLTINIIHLNGRSQSFKIVFYGILLAMNLFVLQNGRPQFNLLFFWAEIVAIVPLSPRRYIHVFFGWHAIIFFLNGLSLVQFTLAHLYYGCFVKIRRYNWHVQLALLYSRGRYHVIYEVLLKSNYLFIIHLK